MESESIQEPTEHAKKPNDGPAWVATYVDAHGSVTHVERIDPAETNVGEALVRAGRGHDEDVARVVCSSCERTYLSFRVAHDPRACAEVHDPKRPPYGSALPKRAKGPEPPTVVRTRARKAVVGRKVR